MKALTLRGWQEVDLGRGMHRALVGQNVWRERHGQLCVEQLQTLFLGRQAKDLVLEPLVLLLQGVERLEHLHNWKRGRKQDYILYWLYNVPFSGATLVGVVSSCNKHNRALCVTLNCVVRCVCVDHWKTWLAVEGWQTAEIKTLSLAQLQPPE